MGKYSRRLHEKEIFCENRCVLITSPHGKKTLADEVDELNSSHEEADTKILLYCLHIALLSTYESTITVKIQIQMCQFFYYELIDLINYIIQNFKKIYACFYFIDHEQGHSKA